MAFEPITQLDVENFGCIKKLSVQLTPLHAFVGPNDSGKSTVLRALRTAEQFAASAFERVAGAWKPFAPPTAASGAPTRVAITFRDALSYAVSWGDGRETSEIASHAGHTFHTSARHAWNQEGILRSPPPPPEENLGLLAARVRPARVLRLDPDELREATRPIEDGQPLVFQSDRGRGLSAVLQAIASRDIDAFVALRDGVRALFPSIDTLRVPNVSDGGVGLQARLRDGTVVDARGLSEGLLYYLGYAVLEHLAPSPLILVEEPENGLHPSRIVEVMNVLREVSKTSQIILATHSPLVLNELQPEEITILTRDEGGTRATRMADTGRFEERAKVYALGDLWVSYANGVDEAPLIQGTPRS